MIEIINLWAQIKASNELLSPVKAELIGLGKKTRNERELELCIMYDLVVCLEIMNDCGL